MVAGVAAADVVVATGGAVTVTATDELASASRAVMVLTPIVRPVPFTVRAAVPLDNFDDPRVVLPEEKVTVPVAFDGFTVAVTCVVAVVVMLVGLADNASAMGMVTVTVVVAFELEKLPEAV